MALQKRGAAQTKLQPLQQGQGGSPIGVLPLSKLLSTLLLSCSSQKVKLPSTHIGQLWVAMGMVLRSFGGGRCHVSVFVMELVS